MKYDARTGGRFRSGLLYVFKHLIGKDLYLPENFSPNDADPAPLRAYLKDSYGVNGGGTSMGFYDYISKIKEIVCDKSGVKAEYLTAIGNDNDRVLTLSWSQVAIFLRNNWDTIMRQGGAINIENVELSVYAFNFLKLEGIDTAEKYRIERSTIMTKRGPNDKVIREIDTAVAQALGEEILFPENSAASDFPCDNCAHDVQGCCDYPDTADDYCVQGDKQIPVNSSADNSPVKFDYSELDTDTAKSLRDCEDFIRRKTSGYFTELGQKFKEAQTLLANHSAGTFEKWYTSVGFKRQTVYNLIDRYEFLSSPTVGGREEIFEALPLTLSYEISKPDAPAELVDKTLDGDIKSNAEYRKLKAELEEANKKAEFFSNAQQDVLKENQQLRGDRNNAMTKVTNLERRLKELENRPVDVAVQQDDKLIQEIERLKSENEQLKNNEPEPIDDRTKTFLMRITVDDFERLAKLTEKDVLLHDKIIHAQIIRL